MTPQNYNQVIVVEGVHDKARINEIFPQAEVVITNGSEISKETIALIKELAKTREIILFLDPDSPGERIRKIIENEVPSVLHAFLEKKKSISKNGKKVGIEHADKEDIIKSLGNLLSTGSEIGNLTSSDLYELGIVGSVDSCKIREKLSAIYPLGHANGKTILKRLNYLNVSKEELEKIVNG